MAEAARDGAAERVVDQPKPGIDLPGVVIVIV